MRFRTWPVVAVALSGLLLLIVGSVVATRNKAHAIYSQLDQLKVDIELMDSENVKGRTGFGAQKDWEQTLAMLKQYRDVQTDKPWTAFHTNEFLPNAASN